jgi:DNA-binding NarL/FixJ family response regulator
MVDRMLPERTIEIVRQLCAGRSIAELAVELGISKHTVWSHRHRAKLRMRLDSFDDVCRVIETGVLPPYYMKRERALSRTTPLPRTKATPPPS